MSPTAVVLVILTGAAFPVLLWTIGRAVTAIGDVPPAAVVSHASTWPED
jgi:hypothetical protein